VLQGHSLTDPLRETVAHKTSRPDGLRGQGGNPEIFMGKPAKPARATARHARLTAPLHRVVVSDDARYVTIGQLCEPFQCSRMWIEWRLRHSNFPKPIKFGQGPWARRWLLSEVEQWEVATPPRWSPALRIPVRRARDHAR
jgi:predicted DNA-binding transcriptional regulator AlpA